MERRFLNVLIALQAIDEMELADRMMDLVQEQIDDAQWDQDIREMLGGVYATWIRRREDAQRRLDSAVQAIGLNDEQMLHLLNRLVEVLGGQP